jgi:hypothetical protein
MNSDLEFYLSLFPEDGLSACQYENCTSRAVRFSVMCAKHHFEIVMKKPCPFTYENMELYQKGAYRMKGWELIINSITTSIGKMLAYIGLVLFGMLLSVLVTWLGFDKDDWLEGDMVTSGILGGIIMSSYTLCYILYRILFADTRRGSIMWFSSGWVSIIISLGMAGVCIGWFIATKIQWPERTVLRHIPLTNTFGALIGVIIGLSIGLGTHKAFTRISKPRL